MVHQLHLRKLHNWPVETVLCDCEFQVGRFRKRDSFDCGRTRCLLCHFGKVMYIPSVKDRIASERARSSIEDYLADADSPQQ